MIQTPLNAQLPTRLQALAHPLFEAKGIQAWLKREDENHPLIQGNKLYKLQFNLQTALAQNKTSIISFGGAHSNHLAALAAAGKLLGIPTQGIVRGQELAQRPETWSQTLIKAQQQGMTLQFISREAYRQKHSQAFLADLQARHPHAAIIPEGGTNQLAIAGLQPLAQAIDAQRPDWTHLFCPVGTGGTLAGLISHTQPHPNKTILGVCAIKQGDYLQNEIQSYLTPKPHNHWQLLTQFHGGGFGKISPQLMAFQAQIEAEFAIELDPVYTVKMMAAFFALLEQDRIPRGSKVLLLHTGGLQGRKQQKRN